MSLQIATFKPDLFAFIEVDWDEAFFRHAQSGLGLIACFSNLSEPGCDIGGLRLFIG